MLLIRPDFSRCMLTWLTPWVDYAWGPCTNVYWIITLSIEFAKQCLILNVPVCNRKRHVIVFILPFKNLFAIWTNYHLSGILFLYVNKSYFIQERSLLTSLHDERVRSAHIWQRKHFGRAVVYQNILLRRRLLPSAFNEAWLQSQCKHKIW